MGRIGIWLLFAAACMVANGAQARVFDFKNESFAVYVGGSFGGINAGDGSYALASGYGTQFDKSVQSATSAEFGILLSGSRLALKLGGEYLMPRDQIGIIGSDTGGNKLFDLNSTMAAFIPQGNLELLFFKGSTSRGFIGGGFGEAFVSISNEYTFTAAGRSALGVPGDYKEMAAGTAPFYQAYLGWEFLLTDVATLAFQLGYRSIHVQGLSATQPVTAITGTEIKDEPVINTDGSQRSLDLGGAFANINLRFYL